MALACEAKANLHPLAFYTIEFTSPRRVFDHELLQNGNGFRFVLAFSEAERIVSRIDIVCGKADCDAKNYLLH
jgi:hypothetical protein